MKKSYIGLLLMGLSIQNMFAMGEVEEVEQLARRQQRNQEEETRQRQSVHRTGVGEPSRGMQENPYASKHVEFHRTPKVGPALRRSITEPIPGQSAETFHTAPTPSPTSSGSPSPTARLSPLQSRPQSPSSVAQGAIELGGQPVRQRRGAESEPSVSAKTEKQAADLRSEINAHNAAHEKAYRKALEQLRELPPSLQKAKAIENGERIETNRELTNEKINTILAKRTYSPQEIAKLQSLHKELLNFSEHKMKTVQEPLAEHRQAQRINELKRLHQKLSTPGKKITNSKPVPEQIPKPPIAGTKFGEKVEKIFIPGSRQARLHRESKIAVGRLSEMLEHEKSSPSDSQKPKLQSIETTRRSH